MFVELLQLAAIESSL